MDFADIVITPHYHHLACFSIVIINAIIININIIIVFISSSIASLSSFIVI